MRGRTGLSAPNLSVALRLKDQRDPSSDLASLGHLLPQGEKGRLCRCVISLPILVHFRSVISPFSTPQAPLEGAFRPLHSQNEYDLRERGLKFQPRLVVFDIAASRGPRLSGPSAPRPGVLGARIHPHARRHFRPRWKLGPQARARTARPRPFRPADRWRRGWDSNPRYP